MDPSFKHTNDNNNKKNKKPTTIKQQQQNEEKKQKQQGNSKETKTLNNYKVISKKPKPTVENYHFHMNQVKCPLVNNISKNQIQYSAIQLMRFPELVNCPHYQSKSSN